jgi:hypothetical protein
VDATDSFFFPLYAHQLRQNRLDLQQTEERPGWHFGLRDVVRRIIYAKVEFSNHKASISKRQAMHT